MDGRLLFGAVTVAAAIALAGCGSAAEESSSGGDGGSTAAAAAADDGSSTAAENSKDGGSSAAAAAAPKKVKGTLQKSTFISGDKEAISQLKWSKVFCWWEDDQVHLAITFKNNLGAHVTVHVQPNYRLKNAGLHGDGVTSQQDVGIDAGATREWVGDLGKPEGVDGQPAIKECSPEINSVELG